MGGRAGEPPESRRSPSPVDTRTSKESPVRYLSWVGTGYVMKGEKRPAFWSEVLNAACGKCQLVEMVT
ncbi:hypothetical protein EVAR_45424_1 [Eumeta japonica]|uniref:Uncharacterized protein n=1 Tax=Eumeta variegata TaxID=151549 RepID=A0A4C1ZJH7_EUMVA|nr:hypothetical protein EVAR_45424_1 [Eumeta japonica]